MRKDVFIKSVIRQPVHSLVLAFLLFIATFSFVLRAVEFMIVREQIFLIAEHFHSIGFIRGESDFVDVNFGANLLETSPYIEISDRRRVVEGILSDMTNAAIGDPFGANFDRRLDLFSFMGWATQPEQPEIQEAIFYAELVDKMERRAGWHLVLKVDDVLVGQPEHVVTGQAELRMNLNLNDDNDFLTDSLIIGERFLFRGLFDSRGNGGQGFTGRVPTVGNRLDQLFMRPLYPGGVWYIHMPHGETIDFSTPIGEQILTEIELLHHNHHAVQLRTTRDMMGIPIMMDVNEMGYMIEGRPITNEDYLNANPVAVIHRLFAEFRGLSIGDSITVQVPQLHRAEHEHGFRVNAQTFNDVHVESEVQSSEMYEIELEIIGIYGLFNQKNRDTYGDGFGDFQFWFSVTIDPTFSTHIYIPDSALPSDLVITSERWESPNGYNFLPSTWYSFRLANSRYEQAFIAANRQPLEDLGLTLTIIGGGSQNFWDAADAILLSITFNGILFSIVLVLVLVLVVFLFLRQRRREFTISRLLGYSTGRIVRQIFTTTLLFLLPIITGASFAWIFARWTINDTLLMFAELQGGYESTFNLSPLWLLIMIIGLFVLVLIMILIGTIRTTTRPVLQLLQRR